MTTAPDTSTPLHHLLRAIEIAGGVTAMAEKLGISQSAVSNMITRGQASVGQCAGIEAATHGAVTCHDLRPKIFLAPKAVA